MEARKAKQLQRVVYINKMGDECSMVLKIVKKQSKVILCESPEDGKIHHIPRNAVVEITDAIPEEINLHSK